MTKDTASKIILLSKYHFRIALMFVTFENY